MSDKHDVIIVGGGASGLMCASELIKAGISVLIFEPNRFLGRKLRITGKGRCNLTNNCTPEEVMKNVPRNPKFLYSSLGKFPPDRIMSWFEEAGVPLKTERGGRVFPVSDKAADVADALVKKCEKADVIHEKVTEIIINDGHTAGVRTKSGEYLSECVVLACGGMSYPKTGSDGFGYRLAESAGHSVIKPRPSLVPIETCENFSSLSGLALKNITLSLYDLKKPAKPVWHELGELSFESFGLSGPLALTASCLMDDEIISCKGYKLAIDFKPGLSREKLDARILRDISKSPSSNIDVLLCGLLPKAMAEYFCSSLKLDKSIILGNMSRQTRNLIIDKLKSFEITPKSLCSFDEAIITRGGVSVKEISPGSMESKLVKDLYFTGEIIDTDGFTGGYNLTIAFSTAYCAADSIKNKLKGD